MIKEIARGEPRLKVKRFVRQGKTVIEIDGIVLENIEYIHIDSLLYETEENIAGKQKKVEKEVMGYEVSLKTYVPVNQVEVENKYY